MFFFLSDPNEGSSQKPSRVQSVTVSQVLSQMKSDLKNKRSQARAAATPSLSQPSMDMDDLFHDGETVKPLFSRKEPPNMAKVRWLLIVALWCHMTTEINILFIFFMANIISKSPSGIVYIH